MIPTPRPPSAKLPRTAKVRALAGNRVLVVTEGAPPRVFEQDGRVSTIQPVE